MEVRVRFLPSACAEFPNDNPGLHQGSTWICTWTRARPSREANDAEPEVTSESSPEVNERSLRTAEPGRQTNEPPLQAAEPELKTYEELAPTGQEAPVLLQSEQPHLPDEESTVTPARDDASAFGLAQEVDLPDLALPPGEPRPLDEIREAVSHESEEVPAREALEERAQTAMPADRGAPAAVMEAARRLDELFGDPLEEQALLDLPVPEELPTALGATDDATAGDEVVSWESQLSAQERFCASVEAEAITESSVGASGVHSLQPVRQSEPLQPLILDGSLLDEPFVTEPSKVDAPAADLTNPLDPLELDLSLPQENTPWQEIEASLTSYLLEHNATRAAALLPALLNGHRVRFERLPQTVQQCLLSDGIAAEEADGVVADADFRRRAQRMRRAFVDGRMDAPTLTRWLLEVTRALLASAAAPESLLEEWRTSGVTDAIERAA